MRKEEKEEKENHKVKIIDLFRIEYVRKKMEIHDLFVRITGFFGRDLTTNRLYDMIMTKKLSSLKSSRLYYNREGKKKKR